MVERKTSMENRSIDNNNTTTNNSRKDNDGEDEDYILPSTKSSTESLIASSSSLLSSQQPVFDLEIQDIEGIGPTTAKKLKEAGIVSVMDLAVASAEELAGEINSSKDSVCCIYNGSSEAIERI